MQTTFGPARLTRLAILAAAAATALSVGACSSSHDQKSSAPSSSAPASAKGKGRVHGLIVSVSGNAIQVNEAKGTATVDFSPSTKVTENSPAQLSDVAAGNCVTVVDKPTSAPGGPVTAATVHLSPQGGDGKCAQPKTGPKKVIGTVASVAGNTINVAVTDANGNPAQTTVTVTDTTHYSKGASATSQAIAQGKCITALGTKDGSGTLQATVVALGIAQDGKCPQPAAPKK